MKPLFMAWMAILLCAPLSLTAADFKVHVRPGNLHSEALNAEVYADFEIVAQTKSGEERTDRVNRAWRAEFFNLSVDSIAEISWRLEPISGRTHTFTLWPVSARPPFGDSIDSFELRKLEDLNVSLREAGVRQLKRSLSCDVVDQGFRQFSALCENLPTSHYPKGASSENYRHLYLKALCEAGFSLLNDESRIERDSEKRPAFDSQLARWGRELFTAQTVGIANSDSLARFFEATSLWWGYATSRDIHRGTNWQNRQFAMDDTYRKPENATAFKTDCGKILEYLRRPDVVEAVNAKRVISEGKYNPKVRTALEQYVRFLESSDNVSLTLGQIELILWGLYQLYPRP